jgi:hypothetical protein
METVSIIAEADPTELKDVEPARLFKTMDSRRQLRDWLFTKEQHGKFTWTLALYGTEASYPVGGSTRLADGTGWVKVSLGGQKSVSVPTLPVDPVNDSTYHYTYCADNDAWEIDTVLESDQQKPKQAADGGDQNATDTSGRFEVGSNLTLINASDTPCAY